MRPPKTHRRKAHEGTPTEEQCRGRSVIWISVAIAEELENIHEHVHEIQIQIQCAKDGNLLDHFGALGGILFKHGAGGLGVVDGHAGEEQKSDGRDDHEGGVAGGEDHENHFGDDKHDEADEKGWGRP